MFSNFCCTRHGISVSRMCGRKLLIRNHYRFRLPVLLMHNKLRHSVMRNSFLGNILGVIPESIRIAKQAFPPLHCLFLDSKEKMKPRSLLLQSHRNPYCCPFPLPKKPTKFEEMLISCKYQSSRRRKIQYIFFYQKNEPETNIYCDFIQWLSSKKAL
jgi:hypothetical protein